MLRPFFLLIIGLSACQPAVRPPSIPASSVQAPTSAMLNRDYPMVSAHRGGRRYEGFPENAIETFEYVLTHTPAIIECDISMTADSLLVLMHDPTLNRTTTGQGLVQDYSLAALQDLFLVDDYGTVTNYRIPTLLQTLEWARENGAFLTLDIKPGVPQELVLRAVSQTQTTQHAAIIAYSASEAITLYALDTSLILSAVITSPQELKNYLDTGIPARQITAFVGLAPPESNLYDQLDQLGISAMIGTKGTLDNKAIALGDTLYAHLIREGATYIATDRPIEAAAAIAPLVPQKSPQHRYWQGVKSRFSSN